MFDLFRSRAKAVRYLLGAILILVALSMVVTLIPGFVGASFDTNSNVVAEIGDEVLTTLEVQQNIQQQLRSNTIPRELAGTYVPLVVNQMIAERAVAYEAEQLGFQVSSADVALAVQSMLPSLFQNGQFVGDEVYAQYLRGMNLTIPQFEGNVRKQILMLKILNMALEGEIVADEEIEKNFREKNEKIKIQFVLVSAADYRNGIRITPADIKAYFDANQASFQIGEKKDVKILVADEAEVGKSIEIPEEELRKAYRAESDRFRTPERVKVRHILLKTTGKSKEEIAQIKTRIEGLLAQLKEGADFAELAKANSEDTGTAVEGGELGWIARGQTVSNFETTAFGLDPGQLSEVITTEYGFHIIEVEDKEQARLRPFEEVKDQLAEEKKRQYTFERIQQLADQAHDELVKNPTEADAIAERLGVTVLDATGIGVADSIPEVAGSAEMQEAIRGLVKGGVTQVYDIGDNRLAVAVTTEVYPARPAKMNEVEDQIRQRLITQKSQEAAQKKREQLEEAMKTANGDLAAIARAVGLKVQTSEPFTRTGNITGMGAAGYLKEAFTKDVGALVGPINSAGQTALCKVVEKIPADMTQLAAERTNIKNQLQQQRAQVRRELLEDGIVAELIDKGKVKINQQSIQRLVSIYTS